METVVRRHKTLGAWVPLWVAGPCRNPECGAYEAEDAEGEAGQDTRSAAPPRSAESTASPATTSPEDAPGETAAENS